MVLNAMSIYDSEFSFFVPLRNFAPPFAGSVDYAVSAAWMVRSALLLGMMLFVSDLSQSNRWLLRLWYMIGLVGGSIAFLGLLQKATGAQMIFWQTAPPPEFGVTTFFATYFYHGNAGAFLRLTLDGTSDHTAPPRTTPSFGPVSGILLSAKHSVTVADRLPHTVRYTRLGSLNTGARA